MNKQQKLELKIRRLGKQLQDITKGNFIEVLLGSQYKVTFKKTFEKGVIFIFEKP